MTTLTLDKKFKNFLNNQKYFKNHSDNIAIFVLIFLFALIAFLVTAINSHGYFHADEHFQIIEFAGLKLGTNTANDLAWEYNAKIRSALQPTLCFIIFKTANIFKINDPYALATILRIITSLFSLTTIAFFVIKTKTLINSKNLILYYILSCLLWFTPYLSVRFSSETWSGLFLLLATSFIISEPKSKPFLIGLLLGVSFLFRFQIAFAVITIFCWLIIVEKIKFIHLLKISVSFIVVVALGIAIDSWFYGEFVISLWNYFEQNIINNIASNFGISPWYFYLKEFLRLPSYPLGIIIAISFIIVTIHYYKNIVIWILISFILFHSIIPHKEERFMFPIIYFLPFVLISAYEIIEKKIVKKIYLRVLNIFLLIILIPINTIGLVAMSQKSAGLGRMDISKYIHNNFGNQHINLIYGAWSNPYDPFHGLYAKFYLEQNITYFKIDNLCQLNDSLIKKDAVNLLIVLKCDSFDEHCQDIFDKNNFHFVHQSMPIWIEKINHEYKGIEDHLIFYVYKYIPNDKKINVKSNHS